jgi:hypothetical protein
MKRNTRSPFLTAFFNPINLAMLAVVAASSLCAAWWLLPVGLLLWLVMFLVIFTNPALHFRNRIASREPLAQRFQSRFDRIQQSQLALYSALSGTRQGVQRMMKPLQDEINLATDQAYQLSRRMTLLENHILVSKTYRNPETEKVDLGLKITGASNPDSRQDFEDALRMVDGQIASLNSMADLLDRFEAQLTTLANVLEGSVTSAIRLLAMEQTGLRSEMASLLTPIQDQLRQLDTFKAQMVQFKAP